MLASSLAFIDGSVVNVALPATGQSLGGYLLPLSALLMLGGSLGDQFGRRRVLIVGVLLFGAASAVCGLAPDLPMLIAARPPALRAGPAAHDQGGRRGGLLVPW